MTEELKKALETNKKWGGKRTAGKGKKIGRPAKTRTKDKTISVRVETRHYDHLKPFLNEAAEKEAERIDKLKPDQ